MKLNQTASIAVSTITAACLFCTGCATSRPALQAAELAHQQTTQLKKDLGAKSEAEKQYFEDAIKNISDDIDMAREIEFNRQLIMKSKKFALLHQAPTVNSAFEQSVRNFVNSFSQTWAASEQARQEILDESVAQLNARRLDVAFDEKSLADVHAAFKTLANARTNKQLLEFLTGYAVEVKEKYEELSQDSANALGAAASDNSEAAE